MVASNNLEFLTFNLAGATVRKVLHNGRSYLVAPASLIVPGVLNGSDGPGYYPPDETEKNPGVWNGMPIVVYHPTYNGTPIAAQDPQYKDHVAKSTVGFLRNDRYLGKRVAEAWFDEEHTRNYDRQLPDHAKILPRLTSNTPIELSTGLHVDRDETPGTCPKTGRSYTWVARNHRPDHLAVLPDQRGACSIQDGCGVVMNTENSNPEGINQYTGGFHKVAITARETSREAHERSTDMEGEATSAKALGLSEATHKSGIGVDLAKAHMDASSAHDVARDEHLALAKTDAKMSAYHGMAARGHQQAADAHERAGNHFNKGRGNRYVVGEGEVTNADDSEGKWVTLPNGAHIQVKDGEIVKGPKIESKKTDAQRFKKASRRTDRTEQRESLKEGKAMPAGPLASQFKKVMGKEKSVTLKDPKGKSYTIKSEKDLMNFYHSGGVTHNQSLSKDDRMFLSTLVANAGKYGNPQHPEHGKFLPHGSGTGKGEVHAAAVEGHKKCECGGKCEGCKKNQLDKGSGKVQAVTNGDTTMATTKLPEAERQGLVDKIVANCKCEGGDDVSVINSLSDAALMQLNAMSQASSADDSSVVEEEDASPKGKFGKKKPVPPQFAKNNDMSAKEWLEAAPPEIRSAVTNSLKIERAARQQLIGKLVGNVAKEQRAKYETFLSNKSLDELETLVEMIPSVVANRETDSLFGPVFLGAAGGHEGGGNDSYSRNQDQMTFNADADPEMDPQYHARQTSKKA